MSGEPGGGTGRPRLLHLVLDAGVDDALALVAALAHPEVQVAGVTAAAGNVSLSRAVANLGHLVAAMGADLALSRGAATRSDGAAFRQRGIHGPDGLAGVGPARAATSVQVASLPTLAQRWAARDGDVALMCLAPMTSLLDLPPAAVQASFARPGEANDEMDPSAAARVRQEWQVCHGPSGRGLDLTPLLTGAARPVTPGGALVRALLRHQQRRGAGLGDAATVLAWAGESDAVAAMRRLIGTLGTTA